MYQNGTEFTARVLSYTTPLISKNEHILKTLLHLLSIET